ncbi:MAG: hypothetical protein QF872_07350, partial [Gammaproteobacteria bacterium]|nr:hypothetical protein [Gammaproteobacteria bacterium]
MSRQRLRPSLGETSGIVCPRCNGQGSIRDVSSLALSIIRLINEEASKERSAEIRAVLPVNMATYLLNEKRDQILEIEKNNDLRILVIPNPQMDTPHFEVSRLRDDHEAVQTGETSYEIELESQQFNIEDFNNQSQTNVERAAVQSVQPAQPAPTPSAQKTKPEKATGAAGKSSGLGGRIARALGGLFTTTETEKTPQPEPKKPVGNRNNQRRRNNGEERNGNRNNRRNNDRKRTNNKEQQPRADIPEGNNEAKAPTNEERRNNRRNDNRKNGRNRNQKKERTPEVEDQQTNLEAVPEEAYESASTRTREQKRKRDRSGKRSGSGRNQTVNTEKTIDNGQEPVAEKAIPETAQDKAASNSEASESTTNSKTSRARRTPRSRKPKAQVDDKQTANLATTEATNTTAQMVAVEPAPEAPTNTEVE